ncbi:MAG: hypothetical protein QXS10_05390 [Candidatus Bathyarchaeia archaeon]
MNHLVRIVVYRYGRVPDGELSLILDVMEECYSRLMPHEVSLVDLYVFENSSLAESFLMRERMNLGISTTPFLEETFFATHDAWRGIPRIALFLDKMRALPELVRVGGIRHEVGHTVLHGSLEYYLLALPPSLLQAVDKFNIPIEYARNILYLASIAVKDYEVTRLLYAHGYVNDQVEYVGFLLRDNRDETLSWRLSSGNSLLEALHMMSLLKVIGCAAPLLADENFGGKMRADLTRYLNHLPEERSRALMDIAEKSFMRLRGDTIQNINSVMEDCIAIFSKVFRNVR